MTATNQSLLIQMSTDDLESLIVKSVKKAIDDKQPTTNPQPETQDTIDAEQAAVLLGYKKPNYIYELTHKKKIPFFKTPTGAVRFSRKELDNWIKAGRPSIIQAGIDATTADYIVSNKIGGGK